MKQLRGGLRVGMLAFLLLISSSLSSLAQAEDLDLAMVFFWAEDTERLSAERLRALGSGFLVSDGGVVITARHVVERVVPGERIVVSFSRKSAFPVSIDETDIQCANANRDACIVRVPSSAVPEEISSVFTLACGPLTRRTPLLAMGFTGGGDPFGGVISPSGEVVGSEMRAGLIPTDLNLVPTMSGGPVLNEDGRVVALIKGADRASDNLTFVTPVSVLRSLLANLNVSCSEAGRFEDEAELPTGQTTLEVQDRIPSVQNAEYLSISRDIQRRLSLSGCYNGDIDGLFGVASVEALDLFSNAASQTCSGIEPLPSVRSSDPVPADWVGAAREVLRTINQCDPGQAISCRRPELLAGYSCDTNSYGEAWARQTRVRVQNYLYNEAGCSESPASHKLPGYRDGYHMQESPSGPWCGFAWGNVVLYYHNAGSLNSEQNQRRIAEELAERLTSLTGRQFYAQKGGGMGVRPNWFDRTIIVHVRERPTGDSRCQ